MVKGVPSFYPPQWPGVHRFGSLTTHGVGLAFLEKSDETCVQGGHGYTVGLRQSADFAATGRGIDLGVQRFGQASLAQLAEQLTLNQRVEGSSPSGGIVWSSTGCSAAWLARLTGGQEVEGSNPSSPIAQGPPEFNWRALLFSPVAVALSGPTGVRRERDYSWATRGRFTVSVCEPAVNSTSTWPCLSLATPGSTRLLTV